MSKPNPATVAKMLKLYRNTKSNYEEELSRVKQENARLQQLLIDVSNADLRLHDAVFPADIQQLLVKQERSHSLKQEEPEPPHIKEEQEELCTSQEGEQLHSLEEADTKVLTFMLVPVKSEDNEVKVEATQLHQSQTEENTEAELLSSAEQIKTEADGENCGGPEPARNLDPGSHVQPASDDDTSDSETEDTDDYYEETSEPGSDLDTPPRKIPKRDLGCDTDKKSLICSEGDAPSKSKENLRRHMRSHTREKLFSCSKCSKSFAYKKSLKVHMRSHTGERPFSCSECSKSFAYITILKLHMRTHSGERPFSCSECSKSFIRKETWERHMKIHSDEKPFS